MDIHYFVSNRIGFYWTQIGGIILILLDEGRTSTQQEASAVPHERLLRRHRASSFPSLGRRASSTSAAAPLLACPQHAAGRRAAVGVGVKAATRGRRLVGDPATTNEGEVRGSMPGELRAKAVRPKNRGKAARPASGDAGELRTETGEQ